MSCINVDIWPAVLYDISTSFTKVSGANILAERASEPASIVAELASPSILTTVYNNSGRLAFSARPVNTGINITVSIVCTASSGEEIFLEVLDGRLITIDGQYIKVLKDGI